MSNDESIMACKSLDMLTKEQAALTNSVVHNCSDCDTKVWITPQNLAMNIKVVCYSCAQKINEKILAKGEPVFILKRM